MIDPSKVTNFNRTPEELEEFLLFAIVVAGKSAYQQANKLDIFLGEPFKENRFFSSPLQYVRSLDRNELLVDKLRNVRMGQYTRIATAFRGVADFFQYHSDNPRFHPLATVPVRELG
jgi:esterase/lipase superfamily enzyme